MTAGIIIQARMNSSRAPGKIAYPHQGEPMLGYQVRRLQHAGFSRIFVATTVEDRDTVTMEIARSVGVPCFRGSESDVMGRYLACAELYNIDPIIRVGGDDPLIDPFGLKYLIMQHENTQADLVYASHSGGWIYGTAGELVTIAALKKAAELTADPQDREHVVSYLKRCDRFCSKRVSPPWVNLIRPDIYLSVDYSEDLHLINQIINYFSGIGRRYDFTQQELVTLYDSGTLEIRNRHLHSGF